MKQIFKRKKDKNDIVLTTGFDIHVADGKAGTVTFLHVTGLDDKDVVIALQPDMVETLLEQLSENTTQIFVRKTDEHDPMFA